MKVVVEWDNISQQVKSIIPDENEEDFNRRWINADEHFDGYSTILNACRWFDTYYILVEADSVTVASKIAADYMDDMPNGYSNFI